MAYITVHCTDGRDLGRYPLDGALVIGRSPDCDIRVHDILASREHCGLEPEDEGWVLIDLNSRNGTTVNGQRVTRHKLADNENFTIGRTSISFHDEVLIESDAPTREFSPSDRPANPMEALSGTVVDYSYTPKFEQPVERPIIRPMPRPMPIANRSPLPQSPALSLPASLSECDSSPTWATKRTAAPPSPRLMAEEEDLKPLPQPRPSPAHFQRRALGTIAELLTVAAVTGAAVVGAVTALTH